MSRWFGAGLWGVVILQFAAAAAAALALYDLGRRLAGREAGLLAAALLVLNPDIARWHCYILTDSFFISAMVLTTWLTLGAADLGGWRYVSAATATLLAGLLRPNGWPLVAVGALFWVVHSSSRRAGTWAAAAFVVASLVAGSAFTRPARSGYGSRGETPFTWLRDGVVIWGFTGWNIAMPAGDSPAESRAASFVSFVQRHPAASARLAAARVGAELVHVRPFYSTAHNVAVAVLLVLLYPLAVAGFARWRALPLARLAAGAISSQLAVVALTFADWDGRFLLYALPLIGLPAMAEGVARLRGLTPSSGGAALGSSATGT